MKTKHTNESHLVWGIMFHLVLLFLVVGSDAWASKEGLYLKAIQLYQKQQWAQAAPLLKQAMPQFVAAQRKQKPGTRAWHQLTLAQIDILLRLAHIDQQRQLAARACLRHQRIDALRSSLPPQWIQWTAHTGLPKRVGASVKRLKGACTKVPSVLLVSLSPQQAVISILDAKGRWLRVQGARLSTTKQALSLKVEAKGHTPKILKEVPLLRWRTKRISVRLKRLPIVVVRRPVVRRPVVVRAPRRPAPRPTPPPVFYKTWWFWTLTGVVVVGGVSAALVVATIQPGYVFQGTSANNPHRLW